jgi:hypothetical protein
MKERLILASVLLGLLLVGAKAQWFEGGGWLHWVPNECPGQLVLDYSNSCALIGQPWGQ